MGLIRGSVACTRYSIVSMPEEIPFELLPFRMIQAGSSLRERSGFVPYEPDETYQLGHAKWAFRVRLDKIQLDKTLIAERVRELIKLETENAGPPSPQTIRKLRQLAEDELMEHPSPTVKIIECMIEDHVLYVGTISKAQLGLVVDLLNKVNVEVTEKTPWIELGQPELEAPFVELKDPGQSLWGCRFLRDLLSDSEVIVEPEKGSVKLVTGEGARVTLSGPVVQELDRFLQEGSEVLAAKILVGTSSFAFEGPSFRISALPIENFRAPHWIEVLDQRMDLLKAVWKFMDLKYAEWLERLEKVPQEPLE